MNIFKLTRALIAVCVIGSHSDYYNTFLAFCPDMVHPSTDETGKSNRAIADIYLREFARIFSGINTQQSLDCGWSDVECF
jgi:hypothetical protein